MKKQHDLIYGYKNLQISVASDYSKLFRKSAIIYIILLESKPAKYFVALHIPGYLEEGPFLPAKIKSTTRRENIIKLLEKFNTIWIKYLKKYNRSKILLSYASSHSELKNETQTQSIDEEQIKLMLYEIGNFIYKQFPSYEFFSYLFRRSDIEHLTIITNDTAIPWELAYSEETGTFVAESFSIGKILIDESNLTYKTNEISRNYSTISQMSNSMYYLLGPINNKEPLEQVNNELKSIQKLLKQLKVPSENIYMRSGNECKFNDFLDHIYKYSFLGPSINETLDYKPVKIIHYAGHINNGALEFPDEAISAKEIIDSLRGNKLPQSLIFLNGCSSGKIIDIWNKTKNLATVFLSLGAIGCISTLFPVTDEVAKDFAIEFYMNALKDKLPIGIALKNAKLKLKKCIHTTFHGCFTHCMETLV